jgi:small conductance mechanosensitive channel
MAMRGLAPNASAMAILRAACVVVFAVLLCGTGASAQALPIAFPHVGSSAAPTLRQDGLFSTATVTLDGPVLRLAAALPQPPGQVPLADRANAVQNVLQHVVSTVGSGDEVKTEYDPATVRVELERQQGQNVLAVVDAKHRDPLTILTVTADDARYRHTDVDTLATRWQDHLQTVLQRALQIRQPATQRRAIDSVVRGGIALAIVTVLLLALTNRLRRRIEGLEDELLTAEQRADQEATQAAVGPVPTPARRSRLLRLALSELAPERKLHFYTSLAALVLWLLALIWFIAVSWGLSLFPQTVATSRTLWRGGYQVGTTWIVTAIVDRLLNLAINRLAVAARIRRYASAEERTRTLLRVPTITHAIAGFKTFILVFMAVLATLGEIGVPVGSVVTIGGVVAIGVSLAAQNFVRDFVNGFLVLFEDQYIVGDFVSINGYTGLVEQLSLRMAQLRDGAGNLITIPHSSVTSVVNHSRNWSRVDYRVSVDPGADHQKAVDAVRGALEELALDRRWRGAILTPVEWIGVDGLSRNWMLLRASVKTAPLRQYELRREINARVLVAFEEAGIGLGAPIPAEFIASA